MMDIGDVKKVIDNVAQKPFLCSDTEIRRERTASGSVRYAEQQTSMDITTAISADRDWDGKTRYKSREIKESRNAKRETAEQKEI